MTTRLCPPDAATLANECKLGLAQEVFTPSLPILTAPYVRRMDDQARQRSDVPYRVVTGLAPHRRR
jgi:hypothetical protein